MPDVDVIEDGVILQSTQNISSTCDYMADLVQEAGCTIGGNVTCKYPGSSNVFLGNVAGASSSTASVVTSTTATFTSTTSTSATTSATSVIATATTGSHGDSTGAIAGGVVGGVVGLLVIVLLLFWVVKSFVHREVGRKGAERKENVLEYSSSESGPVTPRFPTGWYSDVRRGPEGEYVDSPWWSRASPMPGSPTAYRQSAPVELGTREPLEMPGTRSRESRSLELE